MRRAMTATQPCYTLYLMCCSSPTLLQDRLKPHQPTEWTKVGVAKPGSLSPPSQQYRSILTDMSSRSAYPNSATVGYGYPEGLGGGRTEYPYSTAHSRIPQRPQHRGGMGLYAPPPQYLPIPHGLCPFPSLSFSIRISLSLAFSLFLLPFFLLHLLYVPPLPLALSS
jgi:hypothetical protein